MQRAATILMLLVFSGAACAADLVASLRREPGAQPAWYCEPQMDPLGLWHLRCEDLDALLDDDFASDASERAAPRWWLVPTYSLPIDKEFARRLVRAVLCAGAACRVSLALDGTRRLSFAEDD